MNQSSTQAPASAGAAVRLGARGVTRRFGPVVANDAVDLSVRRGTMHAIVGGNGAGKSTLMRILQGMDRPDEGTLMLDGQPVVFSGPADAFEHGIGMVHQEFMLVPAADLAGEPDPGARSRRHCSAASTGKRRSSGSSAGSNSPASSSTGDTLVADAPVHVRQILEILRLLYRGADVLILDEPTAVLAPAQMRELIALMRKLRDEGPHDPVHQPQAGGGDRRSPTTSP